MSNEIALLPTKEELDIIQVMSKAAAESRYFDKMGGAGAIFSIALYARELGIPVMTALHGGLVVVMGKVTMSAEMMNSLIRQKGHKLEILEATSLICRIKGTRKDTGESYTCVFSIEDAKKAGLIKGGGGYDKHTDDMLFARCVSKLKRRLFPDVATKAYVEGEIEDDFDSKQPKTLKKPDLQEADAEIVSQELDLLAQLKDRMKQLEVPELNLNTYIDVVNSKTKKSRESILQSALKAPERFETAYKAWVAAQAPTPDPVEIVTPEELQ